MGHRQPRENRLHRQTRGPPRHQIRSRNGNRTHHAALLLPLSIDRIIFRLFNRQQLDESKHFETNVDGCYLNENGRKLFIAEFDEQLKQTISHRRLKRHVSYQRLIRLECYKLIKHLVDMEPYQALRPWW